MNESQRLIELLQGKESATVEFKEDKIRNEHLAKELGAFANFRDGVIFLGVADNDGIIGLSREDNEERLQNIAYNFEPPLKLNVTRLIIDNKTVLAVQLLETSEKPYVYQSQTRNIFYFRSGTASREATRSEIRRMYQSSAEVHYETTGLPGTGIESLDKGLFLDYLKTKQIELEAETIDVTSLAHNTGLLNDNGQATVLGFAFFRKPGLQSTPAFLIKFAVFQGKNKEVVIDLKEYQKNLYSDIGQVMQFFTLVNKVQQQVNGLERIDIPEIPQAAFREAFINAVIHRDYSLQGAAIVIESYDDRIEIINPGGLPNTQTTEKIMAGMVYQRNPNFVRMAYTMGYGEGLGLGINRIISSMKQNGNNEPVFEDGDSFFKVVLPKNKIY